MHLEINIDLHNERIFGPQFTKENEKSRVLLLRAIENKTHFVNFSYVSLRSIKKSKINKISSTRFIQYDYEIKFVLLRPTTLKEGQCYSFILSCFAVGQLFLVGQFLS